MESVFRMEDVLDVYQRPLDEKRPLVCLDEASKQLLSGTHPALPMEQGKPLRHDSEYVRNGTASLFMVSAPLGGWRHVAVTDRRTSVDFAQVIKALVDEQFAGADKIVLVLDNLTPIEPQHAHARQSVCGLPASRGQAVSGQVGSPLHAHARLVAEHGGDRTFGAGASVSC